MERYNIKRIWAITILFVAIAGIITIIVNLLIPLVSIQLERLISNAPAYIHKVTDFVNRVMHFPFLEKYSTQIESTLTTLQERLPKMSDSIAPRLRTFAETLVNATVVLITVPFVLFFMLKDGHKFKGFINHVTPPKFRKDVHDLLDKMSHQVGSYIQGQIIVSFLYRCTLVYRLLYHWFRLCINPCEYCCSNECSALFRTYNCHFTGNYHFNYYITFHAY